MDGITLAKHLALVSTYSSEQVLLVIGEKRKLVFPQGHADRWVEGVLPEESSKKDLILSYWDSQTCLIQGTPWTLVKNISFPPPHSVLAGLGGGGTGFRTYKEAPGLSLLETGVGNIPL